MYYFLFGALRAVHLPKGEKLKELMGFLTEFRRTRRKRYVRLYVCGHFFFGHPFEIQCQSEIVPLLIKTCCLNECMIKFSFICPMWENVKFHTNGHFCVFLFCGSPCTFRKQTKNQILLEQKKALISIVCVYLYSPAKRQTDDGTLEVARLRCCVWLLCVSSPH